MKKRKILYIDLDNTIVDFMSGVNKVDETVRSQYEGEYDNIPHVFSLMDPMPQAIEAVASLFDKYDCYILSTAPFDNATAWADKLLWVKKYLPMFHKRLILSHHKNLLKGDYLIDDLTKNGAALFEGEHIQIGQSPFENWQKVRAYLD